MSLGSLAETRAREIRAGQSPSRNDARETCAYTQWLASFKFRHDHQDNCAIFAKDPWWVHMGDKSPKSARKRADQKQTKTNEDDRKKVAAAAAKQVPQKKK